MAVKMIRLREIDVHKHTTHSETPNENLQRGQYSTANKTTRAQHNIRLQNDYASTGGKRNTQCFAWVFHSRDSGWDKHVSTFREFTPRWKTLDDRPLRRVPPHSLHMCRKTQQRIFQCQPLVNVSNITSSKHHVSSTCHGMVDSVCHRLQQQCTLIPLIAGEVAQRRTGCA